MAYIPPHKRHSLDSGDRPPSPAPPPSSVLPRFSKALSLSSHKSNKDPRDGAKIVYSPSSISRWFPSGDPANPSLRLEPVDRKFGGKSFVLTGCGVDPQEESPWISIAERVELDLVAAAMSARVGLESETERVRFSFLARIGKVFFHGSSVSLESVRKAAATESDSRNQVHKSFNTSVPIEYMETIQQIVVPKIGLEFDSEKEHYYVKVYDKDRPDSLISCKCTIGNGGELEIKKIELNDVRHLVVDVSCLCKDMDLRLMLLTKRVLKSVNDEEEGGINKLIKSAIVDPDVKGGLRWPLGKECLAERLSVVGIWHTKYELFRGRSMKLRLRHADRYDYKTSAGEVSEEVILKLTGISKLLKEEDMISDSLREMMQEAVKLIWLNFLKF
ncbi:Cupredoxin domain-containing protein [Dioscorea alata]|uniref:Cupredoxin domain-containing protein n=1 Tax=Dioscorea alata TaxID=55571 RepID=A0ACB7V9G2_DIOAL|nr:Cupredoxin domain-containing protein [Dioscorea alata]